MRENKINLEDMLEEALIIDDKNSINKLKVIEKSEGFIPLGYNGQINYVWTKYKNTIIEFTSKELNKNFLLSNFGFNFSFEKYGYVDKKGVEGIDTNKFIEDLVDKCVKAGIYSFDKQKGGGIFKDPFDKNYLIINTTNIWGTNPNFENKRIIDKIIYEQCLDLEIEKETKQATKEEILEYFETIESFNFVKKQQANLLFGWIVSCFLIGDLNWRTHANITAARGSGKSLLQELIKNTLNKFAILGDGESTEAGIRQFVKNNHIAVLLDEAEADGQRLAKILTMFRGASSGSKIMKGTSDGKGTKFELKIQGLITGVVPPALTETDNSRFLRLEMKPKEKVEMKALLKDSDRQKEIGKGLAMCLINNYKLFKDVCKITRAFVLDIATESRYADTYTVPIAASFFILNLHTELKDVKTLFNKDATSSENLKIKRIEAKIKKYINSLELNSDLDSKDNKEEEYFFNELLKTEISDSIGKYSIIELLRGLYKNLNEESKNREVVNLLGRYGIKFDKEKLKLFIDTKSLNLKQLLKNERYKNADLMFILKRIEGSEIVKDRIIIGGIRCGRSTVISLNVEIND